MIKDHYQYVASITEENYLFISEGIKGKILKFVEFTHLINNDWNLGFGDLKGGIVDGVIMTNNQDVVKVIGTVAKITYEFFNKYPYAVVIIKPVDDKRKKLYNIVFQRHFKDIDARFHILAYIGGRKESYLSSKIYDSFELSLKQK
jgi:hypothetical protein